MRSGQQLSKAAFIMWMASSGTRSSITARLCKARCTPQESPVRIVTIRIRESFTKTVMASARSATHQKSLTVLRTTIIQWVVPAPSAHRVICRRRPTWGSTPGMIIRCASPGPTERSTSGRPTLATNAIRINRPVGHATRSILGILHRSPDSRISPRRLTWQIGRRPVRKRHWPKWQAISIRPESLRPVLWRAWRDFPPLRHSRLPLEALRLKMPRSVLLR